MKQYKTISFVVFFMATIFSTQSVFSQVAPVAVADTETVLEDAATTSIDVIVNDTDADTEDTLTLTAVTTAGTGTVAINADGASVDYTPAADFNGTEVITYTVSDGTLTDETGTLTITVTAVNDATVASNVSAATVENSNATIHLVASDADFDALTYAIVSSPTNGSLGTVVGSTVTYTPTNNYTGFDSFTFKANDGNSDSATRTVSIKVFEGYKTTQVQLGDDIDGEAAGDWLSICSFNEDGTIMAVGAKWNDDNGNKSGHVRVYQLSGCSWIQLGGDIEGEAAGDYSGDAISLSSDGTIVAIGAPRHLGAGSLAGHVRVYQFSGSSWTQLGDDIDGEAANDFLGFSVSLSSDGLIVAIGAKQYGSDLGYVRVYQFSGGSWTQLGGDIDGEAAGDESGKAVSLSSDGSIVAIGAGDNDGNGSDSGHVRVYQFSGGTWTQLGDDIDGEASGDLSGWNVSLSSDGTTAAIGAYRNDGNGSNSGHVRVYKLVNFYNQWQGGQSTSWGTANNWSFGTEPIECDDIKIPSGLTNYPIISVGADKVINSITFNSGSSLILSKNSSLSISNNFINNGTVTLNSDSDEFSSLLVSGTTSGSGNVTYNRYVNIVGTGEWDLIGPPVSGMAFSSLIDDPNIATNGDYYAVGSYNNLTDTWTNATESTEGSLVLGQGYQMATTNGGTLSFTGSIANGNQTVNIVNKEFCFGCGDDYAGTRWNLIANPFASYLNANSNADASNNFLTVNAASLDTFFQAIYGWKADGTGYAIYNNTSTATYIAPGQGFFVAAAGLGADQTITFTKAMQTVTGADDFVALGPSVTSYELVLDMHSDAVKVADTKFYFKEGLTLGLDPGYDAGAYNQSSGLSSRFLEQANGIGMSINAMSIDDMSNVIVPLAVNQEAGISLKIQIANSTIPEDINVYLEDAVENKFTLLTNESFELLAQTTLGGVGRFFLHFTTRTLSTDTVRVSSTSLLTVYKLRGSSYISVEGLDQFSQPAALTLYNILGMKILSRNIQNPSHKEMLSTVGMRTGVYILKVQAENIVFTKKILIE